MLGIWWPPSDLRSLQMFTLYGRLSHWKIPNIILKYQQKDDTTLQKHIPKFSHKKTQQPERKKKLSANSKNCANFFMLLWSKPGASWRRPQWHGQSWKRPWIRPMDGGKNSVRVFLGCFEGGKGDYFYTKASKFEGFLFSKVFWVKKRHQCCWSLFM